MDYVHFFLHLDKIAVVRKYGVFNAAKSALIRSNVLCCVEAKRRIDTSSTPLIRASGKKDTE